MMLHLRCFALNESLLTNFNLCFHFEARPILQIRNISCNLMNVLEWLHLKSRQCKQREWLK